MLLAVLFTLSILAFVSPTSPTQHSNTFYEVIVGQNSDTNGFSSNKNTAPAKGGSNKKFGNSYNSDPELVFSPKRDYFDVVYDNFNMLKDEKANKEGKVKKGKKRFKKKKRRHQKKKGKKKYKKKQYLGSFLEYGNDYKNGDIDYPEDYGGTMKFIPRRKFYKKKNEKNKKKKKRRRRWKKNKEKRRKWKAIHLNV